MMNSYPWYLADWFSSEKVASFSLESRAIYRELIDHCWNNGSLPNDEKILQNLARCSSAEWKRNRSAIMPCFNLQEDNRLHLQKVDEKRPAMVEARENRQKGADKTNSRKPRQTITATVTDPITDPITDPVIPRAGARPPSPSPSPSPLHPTDVIPPIPPKGGRVRVPPPPADWQAGTEFANTTARIFELHRRGRKTTLDETARAIQAKINGAANPLAVLADLERKHAAWCASDDWTREAGRYVPWLGKWIQSAKSDAEPPPDPSDTPCF